MAAADLPRVHQMATALLRGDLFAQLRESTLTLNQLRHAIVAKFGVEEETLRQREIKEMLKTTTMEAYERATETSLSAPVRRQKRQREEERPHAEARAEAARRDKAARAAARSGKWSTEELEKLDSVVRRLARRLNLDHPAQVFSALEEGKRRRRTGIMAELREAFPDRLAGDAYNRAMKRAVRYEGGQEKMGAWSDADEAELYTLVNAQAERELEQRGLNDAENRQRVRLSHANSDTIESNESGADSAQPIVIKWSPDWKAIGIELGRSRWDARDKFNARYGTVWTAQACGVAQTTFKRHTWTREEELKLFKLVCDEVGRSITTCRCDECRARRRAEGCDDDDDDESEAPTAERVERRRFENFAGTHGANFTNIAIAFETRNRLSVRYKWEHMWRDGADAVKRVPPRPRPRSRHALAAAFFADAERADVRLRSASDVAMLEWLEKRDFAHERDVAWSRVPYGVSARQKLSAANDAWKRLRKLAPVGLPFRETVQRVLAEARGDFQAILLADPSSWEAVKSEDRDTVEIAGPSPNASDDKTVGAARRKRLKRKLKRAKKQGDTSTASRLRKKLAKLKASVAGPAPDPEPERMQNTADSDDESECSRTGMLT